MIGIFRNPRKTAKSFAVLDKKLRRSQKDNVTTVHRHEHETMNGELRFRACYHVHRHSMELE